MSERVVMDKLPMQCPSCGGACGYTKRGSCRYVAGETEVAKLRRALRDARLLIVGALHLAQCKANMDAWSKRAMKWQHDTRAVSEVMADAELRGETLPGFGDSNGR